MKHALFVLSFLLPFLFIASSADAATITVCSTGCDFVSVQEAVNNATAGDEVRIIDAGYYNESILINTSLTLASNSSIRPTVFTQNSTSTINITADDVAVRNLTVVYNASGGTSHSVELIGADRVVVENNVLNTSAASSSGVEGSSVNGTIRNNTIFTDGTSNNNIGIDITSGTNTSISFNTISTYGTSTGSVGIRVDNLFNSTISNNNISTDGVDHSNWGVYVAFPSDRVNIIFNRIVTNGQNFNNYGIYYISVGNSTIANNNVFTNGRVRDNHGIRLDNSGGGNVVVRSNVVKTTGESFGNYGIYLAEFGITKTVIDNNTIFTNGTTTNDGIRIDNTNFTQVTNNFISADGNGSLNFGIYLFDSSSYGLIQGNTIFTNGTNDNYGIQTWESSHNIITRNNITSDGSSTGNLGIYLPEAENNTIAYNIIHSNGTTFNRAIILWDRAHDNIVSYNQMLATGSNQDNQGIWVSNSNNNEVTFNNISASGHNENSWSQYGVLASGSLNTNISYNNITTQGSTTNIGVYLWSGNNFTTIAHNDIKTNGTGNFNYGMHITVSCSNNTVSYNNVTTNGTTRNYGISIWGNSHNNTVIGNNFTVDDSGAANHGVRLVNSDDNLFYDNYIQALAAPDLFDDSTIAVENFFINNTFNRTDLNFSSQSIGKLFVQWRVDVKVLDENDNLINLAEVFIEDSGSNPDNPTPSFNEFTNSSGLTPQFTVTDYMANLTYNSSSNGVGHLSFNNYTFNTSLSSGDISKSIPIESSQVVVLEAVDSVVETSTATSGGSGSSGGGSVGRPTAATDEPEQTTIIKKADSSSPIRVEISKRDIGVTSVSIELEEEAEDVKVTVKKLKEKPADIQVTGNSRVYRYLNIEAENAEDKVREATVTFEVERNWLDEHGANINDVVMERFSNGEWQSLETFVVGQGSDVITYEATLPGFSVFAVSIVEEVAEAVEEIEEVVDDTVVPELTKPIVEDRQILPGILNEVYFWVIILPIGIAVIALAAIFAKVKLSHRKKVSRKRKSKRARKARRK